MKPNGGKRHILAVTVQDGQMIYVRSITKGVGKKNKVQVGKDQEKAQSMGYFSRTSTSTGIGQ